MSSHRGEEVGVVHEGELEKKAHGKLGISFFHPRYFVLTDRKSDGSQALIYYQRAADKGQVPIGVIPLGLLRATEERALEHNRFDLHVTNDLSGATTSVKLRASSSSVKDKWIECIKQQRERWIESNGDSAPQRHGTKNAEYVKLWSNLRFTARQNKDAHLNRRSSAPVITVDGSTAVESKVSSKETASLMRRATIESHLPALGSPGSPSHRSAADAASAGVFSDAPVDEDVAPSAAGTTVVSRSSSAKGAEEAREESAALSTAVEDAKEESVSKSQPARVDVDVSSAPSAAAASSSNRDADAQPDAISSATEEMQAEVVPSPSNSGRRASDPFLENKKRGQSYLELHVQDSPPIASRMVANGVDDAAKDESLVRQSKETGEEQSGMLVQSHSDQHVDTTDNDQQQHVGGSRSKQSNTTTHGDEEDNDELRPYGGGERSPSESACCIVS